MKNDGTKLVAKILASQGFRNNIPIENIHAGAWPKNKRGKYAAETEIVVTTLDGGDKIPWSACSRINDLEMKQLNKAIVNNIYSLRCLVEEFGTLPSIMQPPHDWDEPKHAPRHKLVRKQLLDRAS